MLKVSNKVGSSIDLHPRILLTSLITLYLYTTATILDEGLHTQKKIQSHKEQAIEEFPPISILKKEKRNHTLSETYHRRPHI